MKSNTIIVGGGAAGLFAAVMLARGGVTATVIEHERSVGRKLLITGKGRCNVTNNCDNATVMKNIPRNSRFMFSALNGCSPADVMSFFEELGVKLKTERGNRVFPESDKSSDIVQALEREAKRLNVRFAFEDVKELIIEDNKVVGVVTDKCENRCDNVIVATGGKSYPATGSTGDGYRFAEQAGHTVTPLTPSLVPIVTEERDPVEMMGLSLRNVTLSLIDKEKNKAVFFEQGEMLFTHFGVSGPLVLSASSHIDKLTQGRFALEIDLKPALSFEQLDKRIQRDFSEMLNRDFANSLNRLLPAKMIPIIVARSGIAPETKVNSITREQRLSLVKLIKSYRLNVKCFRPIDEAIITSGGVSTKEINPKTMESKITDNLYFAGEVIDVDAYTGGFNLQVAFATANAATQGIIDKQY